MSDPDDARDAVRAYKDVIGELDAAFTALRDRDRDRAGALRRRLDELADRAAQAEQQAALARHAVLLQWDSVVDALWKEDWLTLRTLPQPDRSTDGDEQDVDALIVAVERAAAGVRDAGRRWSFGARHR